MNFQVIENYTPRLEHFVDKIVSNTTIPAPRIHSAMQYTLFSGGKRIRPLLVYLVGELLTIPVEILDVIASSIELTHCYSLIHDDLPAMDNDDFRRGQLSCHKAFDEATAILVGDGMQALAIEILLTQLNTLLSASQIIAITRELIVASGVSGMVSGQSLDLTELCKSTIDEEQLKTIHQLKTGCLISACISMPLAAQSLATVEQQDALKAYAAHIGLVFQIQDDYLDLYAPQNVLGKGRSSDSANQKTTFATLLTKSQLEQTIASHYEMAFTHLNSLNMRTEELIKLTQQLQQRTA